ncbi:twin-arginine translocase subunit TatC [Croceimicrobium hydrocarbonivorans]|uniref:Sec-independent protein translocase protein TatC n=1 Tax=Croceimicrobium hydrocarbonivorans TaxID=2761580 RepID=A0A7H0VFX6_9FLAO|nr:twin-arginine translocase subunit TatC [Croceimicrobium hydrocarbonivorans]QNR24624.1 twin-arginine translocase subunit TatC [Croceimicrobium hydrocarbonivorans]
MAKAESDHMSFLEHLEVLRWHLIRSTLAIMLMAMLAFLGKSILFDVIIFGPKQPDFFTYELFCTISREISNTELFCLSEMPFKILNTRMAGQFSTHIWVSLIAGFILAFPYVLYEFWRFVAPGLKSSERKYSRWVLFFGGILFLLGVSFGYFLIVPLSLQFLGSYTISDEINNLIDLNSYISTVSTVTLATGIIFELPVVIYFLARSGLVTAEFLRKYRRHAIVLILVLSAVITPPDVASQILVSFPIFILYEISIRIAARLEKRQLKELKVPAKKD